MSKSPFQNIEAAFTPMYEESVVIRGTRPDNKSFAQTISAAIFLSMMGDSISEDTMDTDREDIDIVCRERDWAFVQTLRRGDEVERTTYNGVKYSIQEVKRDQTMGWVISARSK